MGAESLRHLGLHIRVPGTLAHPGLLLQPHLSRGVGQRRGQAGQELVSNRSCRKTIRLAYIFQVRAVLIYPFDIFYDKGIKSHF